MKTLNQSLPILEIQISNENDMMNQKVKSEEMERMTFKIESPRKKIKLSKVLGIKKENNSNLIESQHNKAQNALFNLKRTTNGKNKCDINNKIANNNNNNYTNNTNIFFSGISCNMVEEKAPIRREMSKSNPIEVAFAKSLSLVSDSSKYYFKEIDLGGYTLFIAPKIDKEQEESYYTRKNLAKLLKKEHKEINMKEPYLTPTMKFHEKQERYPTSCSFINYSKNRYQDVLCNENSKFTFEAESCLHESMNEISLDDLLFDMNKCRTEEEKYINANYIRGTHPSNSVFIATQAPLEKTLPEFFEMIWQSNTKCVLSLTSLVENNKVKMFPFWPASSRKPLNICHFSITLIEETVHSPELIVRKLHVKNLTNSSSRTIYQIHFSGWPDNDVPEHPLSLIQLYTHQIKIETEGKNEGINGPTIVHCSAGIGRAATYISFVFGAQITASLKSTSPSFSRSDLNNILDIPEIVINIRKQRSGSVQTFKQLALIYKSLNYYLKNNL